MKARAARLICRALHVRLLVAPRARRDGLRLRGRARRPGPDTHADVALDRLELLLLARLNEPFIEFFRYLPAPAFGALAVAILGIFDGPKITIIVIGTFFQQVLIIANTTRKLDVALVEAALTLGTKNAKLLSRVVIPGILPDLYRDQRILLGWAWTYLIVAELIGTTSGITWFITLQARYQHFANMYAAIIIIGIIGVGTDMVLALVGRRLFPWDRTLAKDA